MANTPEAERGRQWSARLAQRRARIAETPGLVVEGQLTRLVGLTLEAAGCVAPVGARCLVANPDGSRFEAEVVGFSGGKLFLMPSSDIHGLMPNARVVPTGGVSQVPVGDELLGRVLDGSGRFLDGLPPPPRIKWVSLSGESINPLLRKPIREPLDVGVRAINALLSVGRGQRMGLFAGSGVGKSVLLGMMTRFTNAEVVVVGLIGERGREVQEFIQEILGPQGMARAVVVAAPADDPPLKRLYGAALATRIAEYFRDSGRQVLLLMDSLTRYAQAQREIALAIGEPPATKGYPPSVFAKLPRLVERAGNDAVGGSITAFYTVLAEGDDQQDPIADAARAILDGHVVLSRRLAESGHYPAIDIEASISRVMPQISGPRHQQLARRFKHIFSTYEQHRDLINVGAYVAGSDPVVDEARDYHPSLKQFLMQKTDEQVTLADSLQALETVLQPKPKEGKTR
ncbi:MAG: flagellar protein export ATPase FliI [Candidatus Competibacteraceae bacterium]|nr:flagellar protein export ATPase FliI [Candidatus Competibacteraceae bacterium]MBK7985180.1 flagellar protein export ATPase FliI [Candidatus Competibacteraceae bacterium]MBK8895745.1 flagellar protein export ATPase FliI [Candidatus Competibacteraceae bacterium]MBK8962837.1 flagellar protein export ATPase FliI [Candidatus Competibacteraceae bacterium]MBK9953230.1 flagellar protein export ATPase FliI [Candidatus Competibacteraceae bacterium]